MSKRATLLLIAILTVSSLIAVKSESALAAISKPSVPEFTMGFVDHSYDVLTTYSIDPYTGENVTHPGYHVKRIALEMTIKNQPFVPYYDADSSWNVSFYYNIRIKGYYSEDWIELYRPSDGYPTQSDSEYSVISLGTLGDGGFSLVTNAKMIDVPSGGQVDFQVEAMIGYVYREISIAVPGSGWIFTGETSGWSKTQTLTVSASSTPSTSPVPPIEPTQSPEPQQIEPFTTTIILAAVVAATVVVAAGLLVYSKKRKR
jgi:hypothetical protein